MYSECFREFDYARVIFSHMEEEKNVTVWNEFIQWYISEGRMDKVWEAFNLTKEDG